MEQNSPEKIQGDSVKKNLSFQFIYQVLILVLPLVLAPYLTRTLGDTALGVYSYSYSIGQIFVVLANLGISKYGQRIIAEKKGNVIELRKVYWSLFTVHAVVSAFVFAAYMVFAFACGGNDRVVFLLQGFYVLSAFFDITWFYYGIEKFNGVVIRNTIVKAAEFVLIFLFVKSPDDLWKYTMIMALSILLGMVVLLPPTFKYVKPIRFSFADCKMQISPLMVLFIASVATLLFTFFDKTLLGIFSTKENVAYYEYSNKIVLVPRTIATVISTVMYSRACVFISRNELSEAKKYRTFSLLFIYFISFASIFGLLSVGDLFVNIYYGESFLECVGIINMLSSTILIVALADVVRTQILIPMHKDKEYMIITIISAVLNVAVSMLLLGPLGVYGVVIGSILSETISLVLISLICRKQIDWKEAFVLAVPFVIIGIAMYFSVRLVTLFISDSLFTLLIEVLVGAFVYISLSAVYLLFIYKDKETIRNIIRNLLLKFRRKKK